MMSFVCAVNRMPRHLLTWEKNPEAIYSNSTLSNVSRCYLVFDDYHPYFAPNGSVFNGTNCDAPINPIGTRAILGVISSGFFTIAIILALTCLRKHGATHLPTEKRFRLVSRRWQWYWLVTTGFCGLVSGVMAIDVDRDYIQGSALVFQSIFYYVMMPTMLAGVWEMTRHWYGSFLFYEPSLTQFAGNSFFFNHLLYF